MNKQRKIRQEKGITLVALIITIIVLLILSVVAIRAVQGDNIIAYAENARDTYNQAQTNEQALLDNYIEKIEGSVSGITWTKTSEGDLAIGSTVKTSTNEEFYVIGGDTAGTPITSRTEKVLLLAKNNLKADGIVQDPTGAKNPCAFCTKTAWDGASVALNDDINTKATIKEDTTSAVYKAIKYGKTLGVAGRLMLKSEAYELNNDEYKDILYGTNGKSSGENLNYWLGSVFSTGSVCVWNVTGDRGRLSNYSYYGGSSYGVRPVVEILKSNIS